MNIELPQITGYQNIVPFLNDYYHYRKLSDRSFSYDLWAAELNFESRAFLKMLCTGERIVTSKFVMQFSQKMRFSKDEEKHFNLLCSIQNNKLGVIDKVFKDNLLETLNQDQNRLKINSPQVLLSQMYKPVIQMLISFKDFTANISNLLRATKIKKQDLLNELDELEKSGLITSQINKDKTWEATAYGYRLPIDTEEAAKAMEDFHHKTVLEAQGQITDLKNPNKKFRSIYFSIPEDQMAELSEDVENFIKKTYNKYGSNYIQKRKIVKMNVQFYSLTETIDHPLLPENTETI